MTPSSTGSADPTLPPADTTHHDSLLESVLWICDHYGQGPSRDALLAGLPRAGLLSPSQALAALSNADLAAGLFERPLHAIVPHVLPVILLHSRFGSCVLLGRRADPDPEAKGKLLYQLIVPDVGSEPVEYTQDQMKEFYAGYAIFVKPRAKVDKRAGEETRPSVGHWLYGTLWRFRRYYASAALAALLINVLGLASIFFTMNVYDRVVPNQAFVTLWSLAIGVGIAMVFEAASRFIRSHLLDVAGKKADLLMGSMLFHQAMAIQMERKPASAGSFANRVREFESVRDFVTSASLSALSDLPFVLMFIGVIFAVGGPLGWIPLLMVPIILIVSIVMQWPLARTMRENLREASLKQGILIESIEGMETLKAVSGEGRMQKRWDEFSALTAASSMKARELSSGATSFVTFLQQFQTIAIVIFGVYLISDGSLTQGALIATVMLAGRVTAPLSQVLGLALRFQQAKAAMQSLNDLMEMPVDRDATQEYLHQPSLSGQVTLKDIGFAYPQTGMIANPPILTGINLQVRPCERIAILGRIGSGKSTLLRLIARLYRPTQGQIFSDDIDVAQIDPADWRRAVGFVSQEAQLFYGTLRENVMIGRPDATSEELLRVLRLTGLDQIAAGHPLGINLPVGENGSGLSGGQRQLVSLARTLLARPKLLLLDEPTSAMDAQTETQFLEHLARATEGQTMIVVTHRPSLLSLVQRVVVVDQGKVVKDGPKEQVLASLAATNKVTGAQRIAP
ncbi:type I secretion system permease/ATPase [Dyella mobilis]|uniref:Type I secretion system permease/ATPase n=1 Tax=Dyella mobilis TaxID=1849582 RepID=A0ABS2KLY0_9GAMM|nr:type I secretion system permease/ATPase [Dyella mobilis]MBM7132171.1 type I secretion system permease/ATPase [Dyella mobilis]